MEKQEKQENKEKQNKQEREEKEEKQEKKKLNVREKAFIQAYMNHFNAKRAATEAGYKNSQHNTGYKLLQRDYIRAEVDERMSDRIAACTVPWEVLQNELVHIAMDEKTRLNNRLRAMEILERYTIAKETKELDRKPYRIEAFINTVRDSAEKVWDSDEG